MSAPSNQILVLETGLHNDAETLNAALLLLDEHTVRRCKLVPDEMNDEDWDAILNLVLSAKSVVTV